MFEALTQTITRFAAACTPGSGGSFLGFPTWYEYFDGETIAGRCSVKINLTNPHDVGKILLAVSEILLRLGGLIAVGFVIYGGFRFILSQGEPDKATSARHTIINAVVGLIITILAATIVSFIAGSF